ncbi:Gfo/Idh/MocA family protein [Occultella aeris]|uniref:Oxidoreductase YteT n=1 Tax=Occultella aeris TaxID=2761496 RepID=A0A7M4DDK2_9MICO|nr:Gfo/Idh/MocA family oxidoreductase [Occultella aeris]VZO34921.1 Putative oxidoreductase YteT precursor [Occultella aeris]
MSTPREYPSDSGSSGRNPDVRAAGPVGTADRADPGGPRRRYAVVGLSNRGVASFVRPLLGVSVAGRTDTDNSDDSALGYGASADDFSGHGELVAVLDIDRARADTFAATILPPGHPEVPIYAPEQFDDMVRDVRPDVVIVTSPDHSHARYIEAALAAGVDVISEKPMVATAADAARVLEAERASAGTVRVTHNLRYTARHRQIKRMVLAGAIGRPLHVNLDYHVDIRHGASYFLRWNRERANSGGLTIHKSTHHLDLISWWLADAPSTVYAVGGRDYYGPQSPHRPEGAVAAQMRERDPYYLAQRGSGTFHDGADEARRGLFDLPYEVQYPAGKDLYLYDDEIDIEDHVATLLTFASGATAAYAVDFSSPWEGYRATLTGTHGTIEVFTGRTPAGEALPGSGQVTHRPLFGPAETIDIESVSGGHDGADPLMRRDLFVGPDSESEALRLGASAREGALAVAAGEGIWRSIAERRIVDVAELLQIPSDPTPHATRR